MMASKQESNQDLQEALQYLSMNQNDMEDYADDKLISKKDYIAISKFTIPQRISLICLCFVLCLLVPVVLVPPILMASDIQDYKNYLFGSGITIISWVVLFIFVLIPAYASGGLAELRLHMARLHSSNEDKGMMF